MNLSEDEKKQRRAAVVQASRDRARQAIADGTYTGRHGLYCYKMGCRCEKAMSAREAKNETERGRKVTKKATTPDVVPMTVLHYPPRGTGFWKCPECGDTFLHRPLVDASAA